MIGHYDEAWDALQSSSRKKLDLAKPRRLYGHHLNGRLAQLVEHCVHIAGVTGSSPVSPTMDSPRHLSTARHLQVDARDNQPCLVVDAPAAQMYEFASILTWRRAHGRALL